MVSKTTWTKASHSRMVNSRMVNLGGKLHSNILIFTLTFIAISLAGCHKPHPHPQPHYPKNSGPNKFDMLDRNHDGFLDRAEFREIPEKLFFTIDFDKNGLITRNEFSAHQERVGFRRR